MNIQDIRKIYAQPIREAKNVMMIRKSVYGAVTGKERKEIYNYWLETNAKRSDIAKKFGRSKSTVDRVISSFNLGSKVI